VTCNSEEFYIGTTLSFYGKEAETTCCGGVIQVDWHSDPSDPSHPKSYSAEECTEERFELLRGGPNCNATDAIQRADLSFVDVGRGVSSTLTRAYQHDNAEGFNRTAHNVSLVGGGRGLGELRYQPMQSAPHLGFTFHCLLFARKFPEATVAAVEGVMLGSQGLGVLRQ
jgi:hypothetical protein